jgi:hypothetical protein
MPLARVWTVPADAIIITMRREGETWAKISRTLGLSRNTVIERGRRLRAVAPVKPVLPPVAASNIDDPNRPPLPAGHPLTWGLLTNEPYPEVENAY